MVGSRSRGGAAAGIDAPFARIGRRRTTLAAITARLSLSTALAIGLHPFLAPGEAHAQTWQGGDAGDPTKFNLPANWNTGVVPGASPADTATFGPGSLSTTVDLSGPINLDSGAVVFAAGAPAHTINLLPGATLWIKDITNNSAQEQTINVGIPSGGALSFLDFRNDGATSGVTIHQSGNGTIQYNQDHDASGAAFTLSANPAGTTGLLLLGTGTTVKLGSVNSVADWARISFQDGTGQMIEVGALNRDDVFRGYVGEDTSGSGGLRKVGTGTMTLGLRSFVTGLAYPYSGPLEVVAGTLNMETAASFGAATGGTFVSSGATLGLLSNFNLARETFSLAGSGVGNGGALRNVSGNHTLGGAITLTADTRINSDTGLLTLSGAIGQGGYGLTFGGAGNIRVRNTINGSGDLFKDGLGTLTLTGDSSVFAGTTTADGGTLKIAEGGRLGGSHGTIGGAVGSDGTVFITGAGSAWNSSDKLYVGLYGNGILTIADGGRVSASTVYLGQAGGTVGTINIGAAAGDPAVAAGTLDVPTVEFRDGTGTLNFNHTGATTFAAALTSTGSGTHALNHHAGTTTLTGDSSGFAGTTTVSGGTLLVGDAGGHGKLGGIVNLGAGATLGGTGDLGSVGSTVTIDAGGIHAPGSSQSVLGDYVNHGTLQIAAGPAAANKVVVAGAVDITGATLDLMLSPANAAGWNALNGPFTIIDKQSAGVATGTFNPVTQSLLFLDTQLDYAGGDGNDVTLQLIRNDLSFGSVGKTRNQRATGDAIATLGSSNILWRAIALNGDPDSVRASFDALSGEIHASAKSALIEDSRFVRNAINDRIRAAFATPGASHAPALAYASVDTPTAVSPDHAGPVFWSYGFGSWGSTDSDGNAAALKRSTGGLLVGTDGFVGDWRIGVMTGYSHSRFNASDRFSSGNSDNYHVGAYGGTQWGSLSFRSGLAYTWHELDTRRTVAIPGFGDNLSTRYNAGTTQVFGEFGYGMAAARARFEPFANLAYVNLHTGDFAERGGTAALTGRSDTTGVTFTTAGLRAETDLPLWNALTTLRGMLGWRHAFGDTIPAVTQAFAGSSAFTVAGVPIARDSAVLEAGLDFNISPNTTFGLAYEGQFASGADDQGFKANVAVKF